MNRARCLPVRGTPARGQDARPLPRPRPASVKFRALPTAAGHRRAALIAIAGIALGLAACSSTPLGDPLSTENGMRSAGISPMSGAEVRKTLNRPQRYRWTTAAGASGYTQVSPNGRLRTYWDTDAVNGRIRFTDDGYCTRYDGVRGEREDCYRMYRVTSTQFRIFRVDGTYSGLVELER